MGEPGRARRAHILSAIAYRHSMRAGRKWAADEALERIERAARNHGELSEPDHEVGDLLDVLRALWARVPAPILQELMKHDVVVTLLESWEDPE